MSSRRSILALLIALLLTAGCSPAGAPASSATTGPSPAPSTTTTSTLATATTRVAATSASTPPVDFTVVVLPDSQLYSALYPETFAAQTGWIIEQQAARNIVFVSHVGDLVDSAGQSRQWDNADAAMSLLDGQVPYGIAPGNHDLADGGAAEFEAHFGVARFQGQPWYGGHPGSDNLNSWETFTASGLQFLVIHLAWKPSGEVLAWAKGVVASHPGSPVILSTHEYLGANGNRTLLGQGIWRGLVRDSCSIFLVVSGHVHAAAQSSESNSCGNPVQQVLQDYQDVGQGGDGFLRVFTFRPSSGMVQVEALSPVVPGSPPNSEPFSFPFDAAALALEPAA